MRKKLIIGNWKMNKNHYETLDFVNVFSNNINEALVKCNYGVAPSSINLTFTKEAFKNHKKMLIVAQDAHYESHGAFTGNDSWSQLKDNGIVFSIIGHSERRQMFGDSDKLVNLKVKKLLEEKMVPILCIGESLKDREAKNHKAVVTKQLQLALKDVDHELVKKLVIAYEPIWAIGTGKSATSKDAQSMCKEIRTELKTLYDQDVANQVHILYGGSVNAKNGQEYLSQADIDGALVGGASLDPKTFIEILECL
ncbi:MAG: triose-phosphate isomerase [Mycoplasmoidaceae bacterium]